MLQFCLNLYVRVTCFYCIDLLVFDGLFVQRIFSIKFNPLGHSGLSSVRSGLLERLITNNLVGKACLRFYWSV
jgi:hypothetical protein